MTRVQWIRDFSEFTQRVQSVPQWKHLGCCRTMEWTTAWWQTFGHNGTLQVAWVTDEDDRPIGYLPMIRQLTLAHGQTLSIIGSGVACSDDIGVVTINERRTSVIAALRRALLDVPRDLRWDELDWDGVLASDETTVTLADALVASGCRLRDCGNVSVWKLQLTRGKTNPESYLSKNTIRKYRKLGKLLDNGTFQFKEATDLASFAQAQEQLVELHQKRRQFLGEPGCFANSDFDRFYRSVSAAMFQQGQWKLFWIEHEGKTIAINTGAVDADGFHLYQSGVDTDAFHHEPGWLLLIGMLRYGIASHWPAIDLMRGDERYKQDFGCSPTAIRRLRICHPRWSARGRFAAYHLVRDVKHWWDSVPNTLPSLPPSHAAKR